MITDHQPPASIQICLNYNLGIFPTLLTAYSRQHDSLACRNGSWWEVSLCLQLNITCLSGEKWKTYAEWVLKSPFVCCIANNFCPFISAHSVSLYPEFNYTVTHISKHIHCSPFTAQCSGIKVCWFSCSCNSK